MGTDRFHRLEQTPIAVFPQSLFLIDVQKDLPMTDHSETEPDQPAGVDIHVGQRLKLRRIMLGMSQEDLARAVSICPWEVHDYEEGQDRISANRLCRFAVWLDVPIAWFFEGLDDTPEARQANSQIRR